MRIPTLALTIILSLFSYNLAFAETHFSGVLTEDTTWHKADSPYVLDSYVVVPSGITLTIEPGVIVKMGQPACNCYSNIGINPNGRIIAGSSISTERVIFTSIHDDIGGDTDGTSTPPVAGDWRMIAVTNNATLELYHVDVKYGGLSEYPYMYFNPYVTRMIDNSFGTVIMDDADISHAYAGTASYRVNYDGTSTISNSRFHDSTYGVEVYHAGNMDITGTTFSTTSVGILTSGGVTTITDSELMNNGYGVISEGGTVQLHNSSLHGNVWGAYNNDAITLDATNNWWGAVGGPTHASNPLGTGDKISDNIDYGNFLTNDPNTPVTPTCTTDCYSNVLFLPGIEASRLYRPDYTGGVDKLWEPNGNSDVEDLYLDNNGSSIRDDIYTKKDDIIDELPSGENIYKSFIDKMNTLTSEHKMNNWEGIPYDWRLSLHDIITHGNLIGDKIYYSGSLSATTTPYITQQLKYLASTSKTGKVTIIAHSNGGLLAKELLRTIGDEETANLVDRVIFVASPQVGTPAAFAASMHGYDQDHLFGFITAKPTARTFASTSPMLYNLLPSSNYFTYVDDPIASFDSTLPDWSARFGLTIHSQERLSNFLADSYGKVSSISSDTDSPILMNGELINQANILHQHIDNWQAPQGVEVIEIAGWGIPTTVKGVTYGKVTKTYCQPNGVCSSPVTTVEPDVEFTIDGDGTVVTPSALWATSSSVSKYWVNLRDYNSDNWLTNLGGVLALDHGGILEIETLLDYIVDEVSNQADTINSGYSYLSKSEPASSENRLRYSLHSPLSLDLYDDQGRHTGFSTTTNKIEEQIPDTYFTQIGSVKYLFTNASTSAKIVMRGYATSSFTLGVQQLIGDVITGSTTFADIPTTPNTIALLSTNGDISTLTSLNVDQNSDGVPEYVLLPKANGTTTIPKDTIPPEMKLVFSSSTLKLIGIGLDTSSTTVNMSTTSASAVDAYGNNVLLGLAGYKEKKGRINFSVNKLGYNNNVLLVATTTVKYKWLIDKQGKYTMFAAYIQNGTTTTEVHYRPKKNQTIIMQYPTDIDDSDSDDNCETRPVRLKLQGFIIPWIETQNGGTVVKY